MITKSISNQAQVAQTETFPMDAKTAYGAALAELKQILKQDAARFRAIRSVLSQRKGFRRAMRLEKGSTEAAHEAVETALSSGQFALPTASWMPRQHNRVLHLIYSFMRGRNYSQIENATRTPVCAESFWAKFALPILGRYCPLSLDSEDVKAFVERGILK